MKVREALTKTKDELPEEAFAIVGDTADTETWKLPHHKKSILRALKGRLDIEKTVDWERMPAAVAALSPSGYRGRRVEATPGQIINAARHLADHYRKADKPLPDTLAVLV
jgi:ribosomal protein L32E